MNPANTLTTYSFKNNFNIILHLRLSLPSGMSLSSVPTKILCVFLISVFYISSQSNLPWCERPNNIWRRVEIMKLLIMQFCTSCYNSFLGTSIILSILLSDTLSLFHSLGLIHIAAWSVFFINKYLPNSVIASLLYHHFRISCMFVCLFVWHIRAGNQTVGWTAR